MKKLILLMICCGLNLASKTDASDIVFQFDQVQPPVKKQIDQTIASNEYWMTISAKQLQQGVDLPLSANNSFVRVAPKLSAKRDVQAYIEPLDVNALVLLAKDGSVSKQTSAEQVFAQKEMDDAGFSDGSVAFKVKSNKSLQTLLLKSTQYLPDDVHYLVHVKEKESKAILNVNAPNKIASDTPTFELSSLSFSNPNINITDVSAILKSPINNTSDINVSNHLISFKEQLTYVGALKGLYEIELQIDAVLDGSPIKRTIKIPFVNVKQTANIASEHKFTEFENGISATVPLLIVDAGKFSLQATLQGSNNGEQFHNIATVEMAKTFKTDGHFDIPFNVKPRYLKYRLTNLVLKDHSRLQVLETPMSR